LARVDWKPRRGFQSTRANTRISLQYENVTKWRSMDCIGRSVV